MKKFLVAVILPLLYLMSTLCVHPTPTARAEEAEYACIRSEGVYLYAEENDTSGLFLLPYSYYVKILSSGIKYSYVEYLSDGPNTRKITGYCKTSELTYVDYTPVRPYLYHTFEVTYYIEDAPVKEDEFLSKLTVTCAYYGDYKVGSKSYCYVYMNGEFGYIPKPADLSYDENTEYDDRNAEIPTINVTDPKTDSGMPPAQIALLALLCILIPVIAALILRPSKRPPYTPEE